MKNSSNEFCGWASGGGGCSDRACTDPVPSPSAANCTAYKSGCAFNGTACSAAAACSSFTGSSVAGCSLIFDGAKNCGWSSGPKCSDRTCNDPVPSPSAANCIAYKSGCSYNGSSCDSGTSCSSFAKGSYAECSVLYNGSAYCGWESGGNCSDKACTDSVPSPSAVNCIAYKAGCAFNGSACAEPSGCTSFMLGNFASCSATYDGTGYCGWAAGGNCKDR